MELLVLWYQSEVLDYGNCPHLRHGGSWDVHPLEPDKRVGCCPACRPEQRPWSGHTRVEWALKPSGAWRTLQAQAMGLASTVRREGVWRDSGCPTWGVTQDTNSWSTFLKATISSSNEEGTGWKAFHQSSNTSSPSPPLSEQRLHSALSPGVNYHQEGRTDRASIPPTCFAVITANSKTAFSESSFNPTSSKSILLE